MDLLTAILLGVVEGLTEYLPVSSTGHLILAGHALHADGDAAHSFEIVIQLGAVLAVVAHYRELLTDRVRGLFQREQRSIDLATAIFVAFFPVAIVGLLLRKTIKALLFGPMPVAIALVVGGVVMIVASFARSNRGGETAGLDGLEHVTWKRALAIGAGQCFSLWPGTSRSMCTIVAGELTGLSAKTAAEFSFLVALPTLGAATLYEAAKSWRELAHAISGTAMAAGLIVSFFVAWAVIASFLRYLAKHGLAPFGVYRIIVGIVVFAVLRGTLPRRTVEPAIPPLPCAALAPTNAPDLAQAGSPSNGARILVVEDDESIALGLEMNLSAEGYRVEVAANGETGLDLAKSGGFDLVILDVMLPRMNGIEVLRALRSGRAEVPVMMLSARGAEMDKVMGLELGAEDYVTKPFSLAELLARVKVVLRRAKRATARASELVFGDVVINTATREVTRNGAAVELTATEFDVLACLAEAKGRVLSRDQIQDAVWGENHHGTTRTIDNFILQLRQKLEDDPAKPRHLVTVRGVGYRFVA